MFENVNKELLEKARQAKTKEEALAILRESGVELTDDDLNGVAGGESDGDYCYLHVCPGIVPNSGDGSGEDTDCPAHLCKWLCAVDGNKCIAHCHNVECPKYNYG